MNDTEMTFIQLARAAAVAIRIARPPYIQIPVPIDKCRCGCGQANLFVRDYSGKVTTCNFVTLGLN